MAVFDTVYELIPDVDHPGAYRIVETTATLTSEYRVAEEDLHMPQPSVEKVRLSNGTEAVCPVLIDSLTGSVWLTVKGLEILEAADVKPSSEGES